MAKEKVTNLIEEHVEKGVLGLCALLLLGMLYWVWYSPRRMVVATGLGARTEEVALKEADGKLLDAAKVVEKRNKDANASHIAPADYTQIIREFQAAKDVDSAVTAEVRMPEKWIEGAGGPLRKVALAKLTDGLPQPGKPFALARPELPQTEQPTDVNASHPVCEYPWGELVKLWSTELQGTVAGRSIAVVVIGVEAEAQEKNPDTSWGPAKPVNMSVRLDPNGKPVAIPEMPKFESDKSADEVRKFLTDFVDKYQKSVLQPGYYPVWDPHKKQWNPWRPTLPRAAIAEPPKVGAHVGEGPSPVPAPAPRAAPGGDKTGAPEPAGAPAPIPDLGKQQSAGTVWVWFHDMTLHPMKVYRYRIRLTLVNPLLTYTGDVLEARDARQSYILTKWSEWSEEVTVPRATEFFVVGTLGGRARVDVFAYSLGQRVRQTFNVSPGQLIGGPRSVRVTHPATGKQVDLAVDFSTGAVAVELNFDRVVQRGIVARTTVEMLYLDDEGELKRRIAVEDLDPQSDEYVQYKNLKAEVESAAGGGGPVKPPG